jgi:glycosyltransferase involved in cell wall biosynthesis
MARPSILFVIDGLEFGGGERVFLQLASDLQDRYQILIATSADGEFSRTLNDIGIDFYTIEMTHQLTLKPISQIANIIRQNDIDLLHSQGARADFFARIAGKITKVPHTLCTVAMLVEGFDVGLLRKIIYRFMDSFSERYVERFIAVSETLKKALIEGHGISSERIVKIYNGIELDKFRPDLKQPNLKKQWGITPETPLIGAIGRMVWQKGFKFLIKAISDIMGVAPDARFLFVGEGPLRADLENLAQKLNLYDRVIFTGFRSDIPDLLSTMDVLVVPSLLEGFPMITLEAMAMAKPIIASDIPGIKEQIKDGESGILVPPKDSKALATAILKILSSDEVAENIGSAARQTVEKKFSVDKMVMETERLYSSLLQDR